MDMRICSECGHEYDALQSHECYYSVADILREKAQHGGAREGAGRPALDGGSVRVTVTLTPDLAANAYELGGGNASEGVRKALRSVPQVIGTLRDILQFAEDGDLPSDYRQEIASAAAALEEIDKRRRGSY